MISKTLGALILASYVEAIPDAHSDDYIKKPASEKMDLLWTAINADHGTGNWLDLAGVLAEGMKETFDSPGDEFPHYFWGYRSKDIHTVGVVSKVKFEVSDSPFSGIF